MIYAINKRTKEHYEVPYFSYMKSSDWRYVKADDDGWIEWRGGECPLPYGRECGVKHRDGHVFDNTFAGSVVAFGWSHTSDAGDIIAYRPILDTKPDEMTPEVAQYAKAWREHYGESYEPEVPRYVKVVGIDFSVYDWWTEGKRYEVITKEGVEGVKADDGDFYPLGGEKLAHGGCFMPCSGDTESQEWDGETWPPPVGCELEAFSPSCDGLRAEVLAVRHGNVIGCSVKTGVPGFLNKDECRPIRSEEDRAVEEMAEAIRNHFEDNQGVSPHADIARALYRAGYRKEES